MPINPNNVIFKIGLGQSPSGKILERDTHYYKGSEKEHAIADARASGRRIFVSRNNKKYQELTLQELIDYTFE